jgi:hypothetical protein
MRAIRLKFRPVDTWLSRPSSGGATTDAPVSARRVRQSAPDHPHDRTAVRFGSTLARMVERRPDGFRRLAGATGGLRDIANGVQARA